MTNQGSLAGANVLITGGAGFVGSYIADRVIAAGANEVVVIDDFVRGRHENLEAAVRSERLRIVEGDIADSSLVHEVTKGMDLVFHQAALRITHCAEDPVRAVEVMQLGTLNVLEAAVHLGVQKVISASSASVYGEPSYLPMDEAHPFNNRTLYGALKIANEQLLRAYSEMYGLRYLALRPFNIYGPRMDIYGVYTEVMIRWLERLSRGEPPIIFGDGSQTMDFVFVEDVAEAYLLAATSDLTDEVFNVGSGTSTSLKQVAEILCDETGNGDVRPVFEAPRKVNPVSRRLAGTELARTRLGFEAKTTLRDGVRRLVEWHVSLLNPARAQ